MSSFVCDKCGKECKDKRGLTVHSHKCSIVRHFICEFCNQEFSTAYNLSVHVTRCKTLRSQQELTAKEELITLRSALETSKTENAKLLSLQHELKELQEKHKKELDDLKTALRIDLKQQLKLRDNDLSSLINDHTQLKNDFKVMEVRNEMLEKENMNLRVDKQTLTELNARLSLKDTNTTIINQNDNRVQLNCLEPSMLQGRIHPPDYVIGNVNEFVRMLRSLGVRNSYRVNDKSRGTLSWHKPGEGEVRDPKGDQMLDHIIDILTPDITQEKCYYEEELNRQYNLDEPDVYLINVYRTFVDFCTGLLQKDQNLLRKIRSELIKQGKAKNDTEIDPICEVSYNKFVASISVALFPAMTLWINKSFYELGRFLGPKINRWYHTEGASREMKYIVVYSDSNYHHQVNSEKLMSLMSEALESILVTDTIEGIIEDLLTLGKDLNTDRVNKMINYIKDPTIEATQEIMRGIVSL